VAIYLRAYQDISEDNAIIVIANIHKNPWNRQAPMIDKDNSRSKILNKIRQWDRWSHIWSHFFREQSFYLFVSLFRLAVFRIHANRFNSPLTRSSGSLDPDLLIAIIYIHFFKIRHARQQESNLIPSAERNERREGTKQVGSRSNDPLDFRLIFHPFLIDTTKRMIYYRFVLLT